MSSFLQRVLDNANLDGDLRRSFAALVLPELDVWCSAHEWATSESGDELLWQPRLATACAGGRSTPRPSASAPKLVPLRQQAEERLARAGDRHATGAR